MTYYKSKVPENGIFSVLLRVLLKTLVVFVYAALITFWLTIAMIGLGLLVLAVSSW